MKRLFITGTGTGVGKTFVTATLTKALTEAGRDVIALKPFVSGIDSATPWQDNDPLILSKAMQGKYPPEVISQVRLKLPLSPYDAAHLSKTEIDLDSVVNAVKAMTEQHEISLIEGAGGVEVPITENQTMGDFIASLDVPALVVARSDLGTINHTIMSVNALRSRNISVVGVVFVDHRPINKNSEADLDCIVGADTATRFVRAANLGTLPFSIEAESSEDLAHYIEVLPIWHESMHKIVEMF